MDTRPIGSLEVGVVGLGCNNFGMRCDAAQSAAVVGAALDAGITLFDTADIYGRGRSEEHLGAALGRRRDEVVIATKFGGPMGEGQGGARAAWVTEAVEGSLRRLGTDRIDLYQLHFPDQSVPVDETLEALDGLVRAGKVREIGCSNFSAEQIESAAAASDQKGWAAFASVQNQYSLLHRDPEESVLPACERLGLGFLPYFPLASGLLTGKYRKGEEPPEGTRLAGMPAERRERVMGGDRLETVERLEAFAAGAGHSLLDLAFSWLLSRPAVSSVIAGATRPEQVAANTAAAGWRLTSDELAEVDRILA